MNKLFAVVNRIRMNSGLFASYKTFLGNGTHKKKRITDKRMVGNAVITKS